MTRISKLLLSLSIGLTLSAVAAPQISPQGIIVNPIPTDLKVETWVNKDPSGLGGSVYQIGEKISIYTRVNQDAYVYLFNINAGGIIDLILPNAYERNNLLQANTVRSFPALGARYNLTISGPEGLDQVLAVASRQPLSLDQIADIRSGQTRIQGADNLARALSIIVTPLPPRDWVSDAVSYQVVRSIAAPPAPRPPVVIQPVPQPPVVPGPAPIHTIAPLPVPGLTIIWQQQKFNEYTIDYRGGNALEIYEYYHRDLLSKGWVRAEYTVQGNSNPRGRSKYEAGYRKGNEKVGLVVEGNKPTNRGQVEVTLYRD